jgi:hypothetical protein
MALPPALAERLQARGIGGQGQAQGNQQYQQAAGAAGAAAGKQQHEQKLPHQRMRRPATTRKATWQQWAARPQTPVPATPHPATSQTLLSAPPRGQMGSTS